MIHRSITECSSFSLSSDQFFARWIQSVSGLHYFKVHICIHRPVMRNDTNFEASYLSNRSKFFDETLQGCSYGMKPSLERILSENHVINFSLDRSNQSVVSIISESTFASIHRPVMRNDTNFEASYLSNCSKFFDKTLQGCS